MTIWKKHIETEHNYWISLSFFSLLQENQRNFYVKQIRIIFIFFNIIFIWNVSEWKIQLLVHIQPYKVILDLLCSYCGRDFAPLAPAYKFRDMRGVGNLTGHED